MSQFEYKVVPAPKKGEKAKGLKTAEDRFAQTLQATMNEIARDGWEYQRTDTLPSEERSGLTGRVTTFQNMLVFRREVAPRTVAAAPVVVDTPVPPVETPMPPIVVAPDVSPKPLASDPARAEPKIAVE